VLSSGNRNFTGPSDLSTFVAQLDTIISSPYSMVLYPLEHIFLKFCNIALNQILPSQIILCWYIHCKDTYYVSLWWPQRTVHHAGDFRAQAINLLRPRGFYTYHLVKHSKFYMVFNLRWVFCTYLRIDSKFSFVQHKLISFYIVVKSVGCAVQTDSLYEADYFSSLIG